MMRLKSWHRVVCLLLALMLAFNLVLRPVRVQATGIVEGLVATTILGVPLVEAVISVLGALGVYATISDSEAWNSLVDTVCSGISDAYKYITDTGEEYLKMVQTADGLAVPSDALQGILTTSVGSEYVIKSFPAETVVDLSAASYGLYHPYVSDFHAYIVERYPEYNYQYFVPFLGLDGSSLFYGLLCFEYPTFTFLVKDGTKFAFDSSGYVGRHYTRDPTATTLSLSGSISSKVSYSTFCFDTICSIFSSAIYSSPSSDIAVENFSDTITDSVYDELRSTAIPVYPSGTATEEEASTYIYIPSVNTDSKVETDEEVYVNVGIGFEPDPTDPEETVGYVNPDWFNPDMNVVEAPDGTTGISFLDWIINIYNAIVEIPTKVGTWISEQTEVISGGIQILKEGFQTIGTHLVNLPQTLSTWWTDTISPWWEAAWVDVKAIPGVITSIPSAISVVLTDAFVVSDTYYDTKIEELSLKFPWFGDVKLTIDQFNLALSDVGASPPVIYIDFSAAGGDVYWGPKMVFIDFSWYEPYKPLVDTFMSGALWAFFIWHFIKKLPGLFSGASDSWIRSDVPVSTTSSDIGWRDPTVPLLGPGSDIFNKGGDGW